MKILLLGSEGRSTTILFNFLRSDFEICSVIFEDPVPLFTFLKYRFKKVGFIRFIDQLLFMVIGTKILNFISKKRQNEIINMEGLNLTPIPKRYIFKVNSVNSSESLKAIKKISPDIIIVSGSRILSRKLISSISAPIINIHAGITPNYRGVHGAYWAVANKQHELAGVTVHFVDPGVDTGSIIGQKRIALTNRDSFSSYPLLQLSEGIHILVDFLGKYSKGAFNSPTILGTGKSNQWFHPGLFEYIFKRMFNDVR